MLEGFGEFRVAGRCVRQSPDRLIEQAWVVRGHQEHATNMARIGTAPGASETARRSGSTASGLSALQQRLSFQLPEVGIVGLLAQEAVDIGQGLGQAAALVALDRTGIACCGDTLFRG